MRSQPIRLAVMLGLIFLFVSRVVDAQTCIPNFAPTPPLGFNSFDSYRTYLSEDKAYALMDVMAEKYLPFGYAYFVIDAGWARNVELYPGSMYPKKRLGVAMDEFGLLEPCEMYFPNGIKALADYAHQKGLKFGVWFIRGIPRQAVEQNLPIKGTPYFAQDIADTNSICVWNQENYGIDMTKPGAQAYYNALIDKLAGWGIDFIKVDDIIPNPQEIVAIAKAIEEGGHTMVYSLSPGDVHHPTHLIYYRRANMLRITRDIWDNPLSLEKVFFAWDQFQGTERPGFWPDLDMIPFGRLDVVATDDIPDIPADRQARQSRFSHDQMKTFITQRALAASPLIIGGDLLTMDDASYRLLTNREMLACNQNGVMGVNVYRAGNIDVWLTPHKIDPRKGWLGIFNRSKSDRKVTLTKQDLGFVAFEASYNLTAACQCFQLKDIWSDKTITIEDQHRFTLPAEGVVFLKVQMQ
ncbi:glycoside hydrolase family 27 protein [Planctomycetota bacterium]